MNLLCDNQRDEAPVVREGTGKAESPLFGKGKTKGGYERGLQNLGGQDEHESAVLQQSLEEGVPASEGFKTEKLKLLYIVGFEHLELATGAEKEPGNTGSEREWTSLWTAGP